MMGEEVDYLITKNLYIPTISFRSSNNCNGSVEILHDLLGIGSSSYPFKKNKLQQHAHSPEQLINSFLKKS